MKVRVIAGVRDVNLSDPLCGTWIEFVSFPMTLTDYASHEPGDPKITVNDEDELVAWANTAFEPDGYEIWDMEIPPAVIGAPAPDLGRRLEAIDREITAVNDAGASTSDLTAALDDLWHHLDGRAVANGGLLSEAAGELEDSARRLSDDARELESFPHEAEAVEGYRSHAVELRETAAALRASAAPALGPEVSTGAAKPDEYQEETP
ncbi:hypothetical protein GBA63_22510 (plasmid) [Rubrobacter tropicus]|uniref:Uncharacterized protein n=1 Tax=Rubrobacter tropicus TaxID=2653851 RepID=A0A6G8QGX3_9ACTN|nr:hypothetical protein [Rubrobacter tropicus]QIN85477.1 hypothetical protein GBA63_22510 [Rubrobacter tropicus]